MAEPTGGGRWRRRLVLAGAALAIAAAGVAIAVHTPPVRRYALDRTIEALRDRYHIALHADALEYNLFALRVTLWGVEVAAAHTTADPFFTARRVVIDVPRSAVFGPLALDTIEVNDGRVHVALAEHNAGNLPASSGAGGTPAALYLQALRAPRLAFDVADASSGVALALPSVDLSLDGERGRIELRQPGRLTRRNTASTIHELRGGLEFDGRNLALSELALRTDEASLVANGTVHVLVDDPGLDLRLEGSSDLVRAARWVAMADPPAGSLQFAGDLRGPFDALHAALELRSSRVDTNGLALTDLGATLRLSADAVHLDRFVSSIAGGQVEATGEAPLGSGDARVSARWQDVDVEALAQRLAPRLLPRPTGRAAGRLAARGPIADVTRWTAEARLETTRGITARNRIALDGGADLRLEDGRWRLTGQHDVGSVPVASTFAGVLDAGHPERSALAGHLVTPPAPLGVVLDLIQRLGVVSQPLPSVDGTMQVQVEVGGTFAAPSMRAHGTATIDNAAVLAPGAPVTGPLDVNFDATPAEAHLDALLRDSDVRAQATMVPRAPYTAVLDVEAPTLDLDRLLGNVGSPIAITGTAAVTAHAEGPLDRWRQARASIDIARIDASAGALPLHLASPARVTYGDGMIDVASLELAAGETRISASGRLPAFADAAPVDAAAALRVTAAGDLERIRHAVEDTGMIELPAVTATGSAALLARITGSAEQPVVVADLELGPGTVQMPGLPPVTGVNVRAYVDEEWIAVRALTAEWQGSHVDASAQVPSGWARGVEGGVAVVDARLSSVTPQVVAPFVEAETLKQLDGSVDASLHLESTAQNLDAVKGYVQLDRMDVRIESLPVEQKAPTRITVGDGFARIASWQWTGRGGGLDLAGQVRLADRQMAIIATGQFDLRMLTPFLRDAGMTMQGTLQPRLSISGPVDNPRVDGVAAVSRTEIRVQNPRMVASDLAAQVVFSRTAAHLTELTGTLNGGTLRGSATVDFAPRTPLDAKLSLTADGVALEFPQGLRSELKAEISGALSIPAADVARPSGSISGTVTVVRSAYREPIGVVTGLLKKLRTEQAVASTVAEPSIVDNIALDVKVVTQEDLLVDNNLGELQLLSDIRVIGTLAAPSLGGRVRLREDSRLFLGGNAYVIDSGTIDFANATTIEPDLTITAHTRAGGEDIILTLKGPPDNLETELRSPTGEYGEADLASILLTGRPLDEISGREAEIVRDQVVGYLSGDMLGIAGRAIGFDTVRLGGVDEDLVRRDPTAIATEVDPTTRLTFGKSLGRKVDVTYSQDLRDGDAQAWIVEYNPIRNVEFRFVSDDEELRSYEFRHDVSFGGGRAATAEAAAAPTPERHDSKVASVDVNGSLGLPQETVRSALKLKPGSDFDFVEWQRDRERLEELYRRENYDEARVDVNRVDGDTGAALSYTITSGPRTSVDVNGYELDPQVRESIRAAWQQSVYDGFLVDEASAIVKDALMRGGYPDATVSASVRQGPEGTKTLAIEVNRGARNDTQAPAAPKPTLAEVRFQGVSRLKTDVVYQAAALKAGSPYDPVEAEQARQRVLGLYRREAFPHVRVEVSETPSHGSGAVVVLYLVEEGPRQIVAGIDVEGNQGINRDVVIRALAIPLNQPLGAQASMQARRRVSDTGLFRRVDLTAVPVTTGTTDDQVQPVRVRVAVEQWPALRLRYGFQLSEEHPEGEVEGTDLSPGVSADITRRTLFGRAIAVGGAFTYQRREQAARAFVNTPTMFGWPIESTFVVERSREDFTSNTLLSEITDISWEQRMRFIKNLRLSYAYHFERNHTFDTAPVLDPSLNFDITVAIARLNGLAAWDTRDSPLAASRGMFLSASTDYAPESLGSDIRFVRTLAHAYRFFPWRRLVFASAARIGLATALEGQELLFSERFLAGGGRTVRGVEEDGLGPQLEGEPLGGEALFIVNEELRFPIYRWLGGLGFIDSGNVFANASDFDLGNLVTTFGFGLRLNTPFVMLRVDWGRMFSPGPNDKSGRWTFGIGQAF